MQNNNSNSNPQNSNDNNSFPGILNPDEHTQTDHTSEITPLHFLRCDNNINDASEAGANGANNIVNYDQGPVSDTENDQLLTDHDRERLKDEENYTTSDVPCSDSAPCVPGKIKDGKKVKVLSAASLHQYTAASDSMTISDADGVLSSYPGEKYNIAVGGGYSKDSISGVYVEWEDDYMDRDIDNDQEDSSGLRGYPDLRNNSLEGLSNLADLPENDLRNPSNSGQSQLSLDTSRTTGLTSKTLKKAGSAAVSKLEKQKGSKLPDTKTFTFSKETEARIFRQQLITFGLVYWSYMCFYFARKPFNNVKGEYKKLPLYKKNHGEKDIMASAVDLVFWGTLCIIFYFLTFYFNGSKFSLLFLQF